MRLQGLLPLRIPWKVSSAGGDWCCGCVALLGGRGCLEAMRVCCMLLAAHLTVRQLDCAKVRVFALGVGALSLVEAGKGSYCRALRLDFALRWREPGKGHP